VAFDPRGERIVTGSGDRHARIFNVDGSGQPVVFDGHEDMVISASFSPDGTRIVTSSYDKTVRVWDAANPAAEPVVFGGYKENLGSVAFTPDGNHIISAADQGGVTIWSLKDLRRLDYLSDSETEVVVGAPGGVGAFSNDGTRFVVGYGQTVEWWSLTDSPMEFPRTGSQMTVRIDDLNAKSVAISPDGRRMVTASHQQPGLVERNTDYAAKVWPYVEPIEGLNDRGLWRATSYCPSVELRIDYLNLPRETATQEYHSCRRRVASALESEER